MRGGIIPRVQRGSAQAEQEHRHAVTTPAAPGHALVTRRAIAQVVRTGALRPYGVIGLAGGGLRGALLRALEVGEPGVRVRLSGGVGVDVYLSIARGLPIAEVARQVEAAVRYAVRRVIGVEIERLQIHVVRVAEHPATERPLVALPRDVAAVSSTELAESGTDVA
jgi:uncharacterized alkaline shock family protein YloU